MAPKVGDVVFVAEHNEYDNSNTVAPAIVTYVYTDADGDSRWWEAAKDKEIVEATVFARGGNVYAATVGKSETVTVDDGEGGTITYPVGYATSPDGHDDATVTPAQGQTVTAPAATTSPSAQTTPVASQGLSDADIQRLAAAIRAGSGEPTQTVGDGADVAQTTGTGDGSGTGLATGSTTGDVTS